MSTPTQRVRSVSKVVTSHRQTEGAGFVVRRPFPSANLSDVDPFLLIDEMGPVDYAPGQAVGAPDHPHRGFETVTYILEGESAHEDSAGHRGTIGPGAVQWMTAGAGIVHSEMPSKSMQYEGGRMHGFQVWVNLPAERKMMQPRYQELPASQIPQASIDDGRATVRVVAGTVAGVTSSIATNTSIVYHDWNLQPNGNVVVEVPADHQVLLYVFDGSIRVGDNARLVGDGQLAILGEGDRVGFCSDAGARVLLLAGVPINEPIARYGPFVMSTEAELQMAFADYRSGKMGEITRNARHS